MLNPRVSGEGVLPGSGGDEGSPRGADGGHQPAVGGDPEPQSTGGATSGRCSLLNLREPRGNTLGDSILVEDLEEEEEEEVVEVVGAGPQIVTELVLIKDN